LHAALMIKYADVPKKLCHLIVPHTRSRFKLGLWTWGNPKIQKYLEHPNVMSLLKGEGH
jgi:hypothetical protein